MERRDPPSIWWFAFGYFACYAPYSALSKAVSKGLLPTGQAAVSGFAILPSTAIASLIGMILFLTYMRWWKYATQYMIGGISVPGPTRFTFLSGLTTAAIIPTTTLAYTFSGVSIVFMMLLMRGGVLIIAPMVDALSGRSVRWFSVAALVLSLAALLVAFSEKGGFELQVIAAVDVAAYLLAYFVRLRIMSRQAKSADPDANLRYFVEEQIVATPSLIVVLAALALVGHFELLEELRYGFVRFWTESGVAVHALLIGLFSQGTGIFGGLILLDKRENTFCVPVNRASSVLAGIVASGMLTLWVGERFSSAYEIGGAGLIIAALMFLSIPPILEKSRSALAR